MKDTVVPSNLYWDKKATVKIDNVKTEWVDMERGVRQGRDRDKTFPDIFSFYGQRCMEELQNVDGIKFREETTPYGMQMIFHCLLTHK